MFTGCVSSLVPLFCLPGCVCMCGCVWIGVHRWTTRPCCVSKYEGLGSMLELRWSLWTLWIKKRRHNYNNNKQPNSLDMVKAGKQTIKLKQETLRDDYLERGHCRKEELERRPCWKNRWREERHGGAEVTETTASNRAESKHRRRERERRR